MKRATCERLRSAVIRSRNDDPFGDVISGALSSCSAADVATAKCSERHSGARDPCTLFFLISFHSPFYTLRNRHDFVINIFLLLLLFVSLLVLGLALQRAALAEKELSILKEQFERRASENKAASSDQANEAPPSLPNMDTPLDVMGRPSLLELAAKEKEVSANVRFRFSPLLRGLRDSRRGRHLAAAPRANIESVLRLAR